MKMATDNLKRVVTKWDVIAAIGVIILMGVPYGLREIYPHNEIIKKLFGGIRLLIYWSIIGYVGWIIDRRFAKDKRFFK
jgi:hypothetical protein